MYTFAKAQIASFVASIVDYFITILCVELFGFWYVVGRSTENAHSNDQSHHDHRQVK